MLIADFIEKVEQSDTGATLKLADLAYPENCLHPDQIEQQIRDAVTRPGLWLLRVHGFTGPIGIVANF